MFTSTNSSMFSKSELWLNLGCDSKIVKNEDEVLSCCEVDLPLSRCRMFQLRPPSVRPVVSGPGPDVNTAPVFVLARPSQETSPVWPLCIPKHTYPMAIDECRPSKQSKYFTRTSMFRKDFRGRFHVLDLIWGSRLKGAGGSDLYVFSLPAPLFQRSVDVDILLMFEVDLGWRMNNSTPTNAECNVFSAMKNTVHEHVV